MATFFDRCPDKVYPKLNRNSNNISGFFNDYKYVIQFRPRNIEAYESAIKWCTDNCEDFFQCCYLRTFETSKGHHVIDHGLTDYIMRSRPKEELVKLNYFYYGFVKQSDSLLFTLNWC